MRVIRENDDTARVAELKLPLPPRVVVIDSDSAVVAPLDTRRLHAATDPAGASVILIVARAR